MGWLGLKMRGALSPCMKYGVLKCELMIWSGRGALFSVT
jgi:hypothetical protein